MISLQALLTAAIAAVHDLLPKLPAEARGEALIEDGEVLVVIRLAGEVPRLLRLSRLSPWVLKTTVGGRRAAGTSALHETLGELLAGHLGLRRAA